MATATRHLCRIIPRVSRSIPAKRKCQRFTRIQSVPSAPLRPFSSSRIIYAKEDKDEDIFRTETEEDLDPNEFMTPATPYTSTDLDPQERATYDVMTPDQQKNYLALQNHFKALFESEIGDEALEEAAEKTSKQIDREEPELDLSEVRNAKALSSGFWASEEDDEFGMVPDDDDVPKEEHITSVAESELEVHREVREYTRIAAWDLPLLQQYATPFTPPDHSTPLRFRYTTYMGEYHPAAKKVVVEFCTKDLTTLTEPQRIKLIKLVGVRYNPSTDVVRMSCEKFENPAQNKRYLGNLVNSLVAEAKDSKDTFEDVPIDLRHHKAKKQIAFPEEWKITPVRVQALLGQKKELKVLEEGEKVVDGQHLVHEFVKARRLSPLRVGA